MTTQQIIFKPVVELVEEIAKGNLSSFEVVEAFWNRAKQVNPHINAIVEWNEKALEEAKELDEYYKVNKKVKGVLHGIPVTVKEMIGAKGFKQTGGGMHALSSFVAVGDCTAAARLKEAGAIILGTTNDMELGLSFDTDNSIYGRTKNPYDLSRSPGGSTGGEAAIIAAGGSPLGIGSDLGGSVRVPPHFCGIVGLKPTQYLVPLTNFGPLQIELLTGFMPSMLVNGPLARYTSDVELALQVISGPDFEDPNSLIPAYKSSQNPALPKRVAYFTDDGLIPTAHPSVQDAVRKVAKVLESQGVEVVETMPSEFIRGNDMMFRAFGLDGVAGAKMLLSLGNQTPNSNVKKLLDDVDSKPLLLTTLTQFTQLQTEITLFRRQMLRFFKDYDALILPPCAFPALTPDKIAFEIPGQHNIIASFRFTYTWNVASLPALVVGAVSTGTDEFAGLPVGVQIVFPPNHEATAFAIGRIIEDQIPSTRSMRPPESNFSDSH